MKRVIKALINRAPFIKNFSEQIRKQGRYPAGHYYSPIPSKEDVLAYVKSRNPPNSELAGIELNEQSQYKLLNMSASIKTCHSQKSKHLDAVTIMTMSCLAIQMLFSFIAF